MIFLLSWIQFGPLETLFVERGNDGTHGYTIPNFLESKGLS